LWVVGIEESLEPLSELFGVAPSSARGFDVKDFAGLIKGHPRRGCGSSACLAIRVELGLGAGVLRGCLCLLVGGGEGPAKDSTADKYDLGNNTIGLDHEGKVLVHRMKMWTVEMEIWSHWVTWDRSGISRHVRVFPSGGIERVGDLPS
jgi:hypothetical protein